MAVRVPTVAMTASLLLILLLHLAAAPVSSARYATIGKFVAKGVRSIVKESAKDYMEKKVQQGITNRSGQSLQMGSAAADSSGALVFNLSVGTSPQTLPVVLDITSELVWAQCEPCSSCVRSTTPTTPTFLPNNSDSFVKVGCKSQTCQRMIPGDHGCTGDDDLCGYTETFYGAGKTSGFLATETFSFETAPVPDVVFGCSSDIMVPDLDDGTSGFAGFSRGPLSLVSQLNLSSFTYFIAPLDDATGKNFVSWSWHDGADLDVTAAQMMAGGRPSSTPLLAATENQNKDLYYVNLTGLQLDGQLLTAIPAGTFDVRSDGSGGVFLSTTLPVTYLQEDAYRILRQELVSRIQSKGVVLVAGDPDYLCFLTQFFANDTVPKLSLVFDGADAAMELKVENYFFAVPGGLQTCLTILPSTSGSILGSLLQVGRTMTYDIHGGQLTFETAAAGALAPERALLMITVTLLVWVLGQHCPF